MLHFLTRLFDHLLSFINKLQFSRKTIYEGWLPTKMDWHPPMYPVNFSDTRLFDEFGHSWVSLSPHVNGSWVTDNGEEVQPYVHCEASYWRDNLYSTNTNYSILLSGGDDYYQTKDYSSREEIMKDLDLIMSAPIKYELLKELGFDMDI